MDINSRLIARSMFRLRIHEAKGFEYQRLFERVMQYRHVDFVPVKPYGRVGDRKNDGYIPSRGCYFQVFAPEEPTKKETSVKAASKACADFKELKAYWDKLTPVRDFRFVFNDEYRGSPPPLEQALAEIRSKHGVAASVFLAKDLEAEALLLTQEQLIDVIGVPIPETGPLSNVDFGALREVIRHVLDQRAPFTPDAVLKAPDFNDKIRFNGLSATVAALLQVGSYQIEAVEDYFYKNSSFARQGVRDHLYHIYTTSRARIELQGHKEPEIGDLVFFDLLQQVMPNSSGLTQKQLSAAQDAAIVVMSYYFEACDIFEVPGAVT